MSWRPTQEWSGEEAFLIGGGSSLKTFDFGLLAGRNTIGANDAFRLGPEIVSICLFGDSSWFHRTKWDLEKFPNRVVTCATGLNALNLPWLLRMDRCREGLGHDGALGWNYSTGAAAISLAYLLGARKAFLLGYDMGLNHQHQSHWHNHLKRTTPPASFARHLQGLGKLAADAKKHPEFEIVNVTDGGSHVHCFPKMSFVEFSSYLYEHHQENAEAKSSLVEA